MEPLPKEKNPGVYKKYTVNRTDGKSTEGHEYLVVRTDEGGKHRQAALAAACKFAQKIEEKDPELSDSMWERYRPLMDHSEEVVVMLPFHWGKGSYLDDAISKCLDQTGIPDEEPPKIVAKRGKDLSVDSYGGIRYRGDLEEIDEEEVKEAFKSALCSRFEQTLCDIDNFATMKGKEVEVKKLTDKIAEILGKDYGL